MNKRLLVIFTIAVFLLSGCSNVIVNKNQSNYETDEEINAVLEDVSKVVIVNNSGNINVKPGRDSSLKGMYRKKTKGSDASEINKVANSITHEVKNENGTVYINSILKDSAEGDVWEWKNRQHPNVNLNIEFDLELPKNISAIEITQTAGNIDIKDYTGNINLHGVAGNVKINDTALSGSNIIKLTTGNVELGLKSLDTHGSLNAKVTTGNINLYTENSVGFDLSAQVGTGNITGNITDGNAGVNSSFTRKVNNGGAAVDLFTQTGNITVDAENKQSSDTIEKDDFGITSNHIQIKLMDWNDKIDLETALGKPGSVEKKVLGDGADTFKGTFWEKRIYNNLELILLSPKDNGKTYYIQNMKITGQSYRTARDITLGSNVNEVLEKYPQAVWNYKKDNSNGSMRFSGSDNRYIDFDIENGKVKTIELVYELQ